MTILARVSVGRILLHLLAMLGDRCVRFHVAGIMRELSSFTPERLVSRIVEQMRDPVAQLVHSKTLRKLAPSWGPYCLAAAILPGGIVLVPLLFLFRRRKAVLVRRRTLFDHV
jgi:hypothetical protein